MNKMAIVLSILVILFSLGIGSLVINQYKQQGKEKSGGTFIAKISPSPTDIPLPKAKTLQNNYQVFETFNNCGPASLSMALSYFGIQKSQDELGQALRPYQNPQGDNDDKDVTLSEMAMEAENQGLLAYYRPNGDITRLKKFVANDMPVITETLLTKTDDIGHFRVVKGYDDTTHTVIQDDSYQGHNMTYSYADFTSMWEKYNYQYLVLVPKNKQKLAEQILGTDLNEITAWQATANKNKQKLQTNPADVTSRFNLSIALYYLGQYQSSVTEFEKIEGQLPFRTLWYQIEPIKAYYKLGNYEKVFSLTGDILNNGNRAFSELYIIQGNIYKIQGNNQAAKEAYERAVFYNTNLLEAKNALDSV